MKRIWELDAFRGLCILCVIAIHTVFDLQYFVGLPITLPAVLQFVMDYGGVLFVILSGVCATLGSHSVRRGLIVFACGMVVTLVTEAMIALGMADASVRIWFGVLHLLGVCMVLYPLFRRLPTWALLALGAVLVGLGYWFRTFTVAQPWWFPLGLCAPHTTFGDYFPLCPHLGWFLLGTALGRTVYRERRSLWPNAPADRQPLRFLRACGRHSLWIYLLHQPVVYGILTVIVYITARS